MTSHLLMEDMSNKIHVQIRTIRNNGNAGITVFGHYCAGLLEISALYDTQGKS